jgi:DNA-binding CsgD family transcriptional regulator
VELGSPSPRSFARSAVLRRPASALSRCAGYERDPLYERVVATFGYADELRVTCSASGACWGAVSLWRRAQDGLFTATHERLLDDVAGQLGDRLRASVVTSMTQGSQGPRRHGLIVIEDERVVDVSPEAVRLMGALEHDPLNHYRFLEYLTTQAAADPEMSLLLTSEEGQWFSADAYPMGTPGRTAIVLSDAAPTHLLKTLTAGARLTPREVEVALLICRGCSDSEIARQLGISQNTAQDHVKAIRAKLGVSRRSAITARLFADYYFQDFLTVASIDHSEDSSEVSTQPT